MKKFFLLGGALFILSACANVAEFHSACMKTNTAIAGQVACVKANVAQSPDLQSDTLVEEYLKTGDLLVEQVQTGTISEAEAQMRFIQKLNDIRQQGLREDAYRAQIFEAYYNRFPRHTTCTPSGDDLHCTTY